ncbi:MAG: cupin domain-containing protein [Candidatus Humimicrobiaceae bacterium]
MIVKKRKDLVRKELNDSNAKDVNFYPVITTLDGAPNFALRLFEIEPGGYTPYHSHAWEHEVYIIEGEGFIIGENKKSKIEKNDFLFIEPTEIHQFMAGEKELKMICIVPNEGQPK